MRADWFEPGTPFRSTAEIVGAEGTLRFDTANAAASDDPYTAQLADFVDAIRTGRDARVTPEDGVAAVTLVDAAYASLATRKPVLL